MTIFVGGRQKRVRRPPTIDGLSSSAGNTDPVWLHQNDLWEELYELEGAESLEAPEATEKSEPNGIPF